jgi:hypothetical protein
MPEDGRARKLRKISVYVDPDDDERLRRLSRRTRITASVLLRQALRELLDREEGGLSRPAPARVPPPSEARPGGRD